MCRYFPKSCVFMVHFGTYRRKRDVLANDRFRKDFALREHFKKTFIVFISVLAYYFLVFDII